jgi:hypothetical protein
MESSGVSVFEVHESAQFIFSLHDLEVVWEPTAVHALLIWKGWTTALVRVPQRGGAIVAATLKPEQIPFCVKLDLHGSTLASNGRHGASPRRLVWLHRC